MNNRGFSLLEVLVGFALMSALSIGVMKMTAISKKSAKTVSQSFELPIILNGVRSFLADEDVCKNNFAGTVLTGSHIDDSAVMSNFNDIKDVDNQIRYDKVKVFGNNELKVVDFKIGGFDPHDSSDPTNLLGESKIIITFERLGKSFGSKTIIKEIILSARVDDLVSRTVSTCHAKSSGDNDGLWSRASNGIKYEEGMVGIGISDPLINFHVVGGNTVGGVNPSIPYLGNNVTVVIENPNLTNSSNAAMALVTSSANAIGALHFSDKSIGDHPGGMPWDGAIAYSHEFDHFMIMTYGGISGGSPPLYLKKDGHMTLGYNQPPTDAKAYKFTLDIKSDTRVPGGSGLRIVGNEVVSNQGRARIILQDVNSNEWALNSMGIGAELPGAFSIGHPNTAIYPLAINKNDQILMGHLGGPGSTEQYRLDVKSMESVPWGSGIRVFGNEAVLNDGRAQIVLQDINNNEWALNSMGDGAGIPLKGSFSIGNRKTGRYSVVVNDKDQILMGYAPQPTDPSAHKYRLDINTMETVQGGSGIRITGNESVQMGMGRARITLSDLHEWNLNSHGAKGWIPGMFTIGHKNTTSHVFVITPDDKFGFKPGLSSGWTPVRDFEFFGDLEVKDNKTLYTSFISSSTAVVRFSKPAEGPSFTSPSDMRLKTNIEPLFGPLDKILSLSGITFNWIAETGFDTEKRQMGLSAQEVLKVFPQAVTKNESDELGVNYSSLIAPLIDSVKILSQKVESLQAEIKMLKESGDFRTKNIDD